MQPLSFQVLEVTLNWQAEERVKGVPSMLKAATPVGAVLLITEEKSQAVN